VAALQGLHADVFVTSTPGVAVTDEAMSDISANVPGQLVRTCYAVTNAVKRYFDPTAVNTFTISLDSGTTWNPVTPDHVEAGFIRFNASQQAAPAAQFRFHSGNYLPYAHMAGSNEWTLTPSVAMADITEFGALAKTYKTTLQDASVSVKKFWVDDTLRATMGNLLILALYVNAAGQPAGPRYECLAFLKDEQLKAAVAGIIDNTLNFQVHAPSGATNSVWFLSN